MIRAQLKKAMTKAANYLYQLSFASRVRDSAWANRLFLGFETFRASSKDTSRKIDLDLVHIDDIPYISETMRRLTSLG